MCLPRAVEKLCLPCLPFMERVVLAMASNGEDTVRLRSFWGNFTAFRQ